MQAISWDNNSSVSSQVHVKCRDGSSYTADHILITVSLGVLKENYKIWFTPELPAYKINAIENLTLGTVNKIILKFPEKWWPDDISSFSFLWKGTDTSKSDVNNIEPKLNGLSWAEYIFGAFVLDSHPKVLLIWMVGELATEIEKLSDDVVIRNCMYFLKKFLGKEYQVLDADAVLR